MSLHPRQFLPPLPRRPPRRPPQHLRRRREPVAAESQGRVGPPQGAGEELLGASAEVDAGGNKKLPAIGEWLVAEIKKHFKASGKEATLKYIDPSYMVRSVAADAGDSYLCMLLAHAAAHGSMAGYTGFTVGLVNNRTVRGRRFSRDSDGGNDETSYLVGHDPHPRARADVAAVDERARQDLGKGRGRDEPALRRRS